MKNSWTWPHYIKGQSLQNSSPCNLGSATLHYFLWPGANKRSALLPLSVTPTRPLFCYFNQSDQGLAMNQLYFYCVQIYLYLFPFKTVPCRSEYYDTWFKFLVVCLIYTCTKMYGILVFYSGMICIFVEDYLNLQLLLEIPTGLSSWEIMNGSTISMESRLEMYKYALPFL